MRKIATIICATLMVCTTVCSMTNEKVTTTNTNETQETTVVNDNKAKEFLEAFYAGLDEIEENNIDIDKVYAYIKEHSTESAIDILKENYGYECEGECLAFWMLEKGEFNDPGEFVSRKITQRGDNKFLVENKYTETTNRIIIEVTNTEDGFKISNIKYQD